MRSGYLNLDSLFIQDWWVRSPDSMMAINEEDLRLLDVFDVFQDSKFSFNTWWRRSEALPAPDPATPGSPLPSDSHHPKPRSPSGAYGTRFSPPTGKTSATAKLFVPTAVSGLDLGTVTEGPHETNKPEAYVEGYGDLTKTLSTSVSIPYATDVFHSNQADKSTPSSSWT